jgi:WD40 repeat protein/predicted Ser/Thr protein kinase
MPGRIGRFEVLERLGQGAFGQVFRARDPQLDREVAIKTPLTGSLESPEDLERFLREAQAAATLHHPNICPVYEVGQMGKLPFIVMAFLRGQSLADHLKGRKEPLPAKQAALVARKLALALDAAHAQGIVHRDLKPANVMFERDRKDVVVMDFGLARRVRPGDIRQTREGTVMGTPAYMAPEQARGDVQAIGPASDQYSLGVMLYEMLAGRLPFTGNVNEVLGQVLHVAPAAPSKYRPGIDPTLEAICLRAMAKAPGDRHASLKEMAAALNDWLRGTAQETAVQATPAPAPGEAGAVAQVVAALAEERRAESQERREEARVAAARSRRDLRRLALWVGAPALVLAAVAVAAVVILGNRPPEGGPTNNNITDNSVNVTLVNVPHHQDAQVVYLLDGRKIDRKEFTGPMSLKVGPHELVLKRGEETLEVRKFHVKAEDDQQEVKVPPAEKGPVALEKPEQVVPDKNPQKVVPIDEPEGKVGELYRFSATASGVMTGARFSPDGRWVLAAEYTGQPTGSGVRRWDMKNPKDPPKIYPFRNAYRVAFDPRNNHQALFANLGGEVEVWDLQRTANLRLDSRGSGVGIGLLAYSASGEHYVIGWAPQERVGRAEVRETATGNVTAEFNDRSGVIFAADNRHVFTFGGAKGNELHMLDLPSKQVVQVYKGHTSPLNIYACSADGRYVAAAAVPPTIAIRVWEVQTGQELPVMLGHEGHVTGLNFSPDGRRLLSSAITDNSVRLWDIESGNTLAVFKHDSNVYDVQFSPRGNLALSCSDDRTVRVWQLPR